MGCIINLISFGGNAYEKNDASGIQQSIYQCRTSLLSDSYFRPLYQTGSTAGRRCYIRLMEQFDLVLFASKGAARALETSMTPKIHFLICIRTFNFTYLNKILSIPPNSDVYLVNDSEKTTKSAIRLLSTYGFSQYHFVPYYPGCGEADYSIQYAVTLGEEAVCGRDIFRM